MSSQTAVSLSAYLERADDRTIAALQRTETDTAVHILADILDAILAHFPHTWPAVLTQSLTDLTLNHPEPQKVQAALIASLQTIPIPVPPRHD